MNFIKTNKTIMNMLILGLMFITMPSLEAAQHARKIAAGLGAAAYWGLTAGQLVINLAGDYLFEKAAEDFERVDKQEPACEKTKAFLKAELIRLGLPNVRIFSSGMTFAHGTYIMLDRDLLQKNEEALEHIEHARFEQKEVMQSDVDIISRLKGILHHEASHILHEDRARNKAAILIATCLPLGARGLYGCICKGASISSAPRIIHGFGNALITNQLHAAFHRKIEQQADDAVQDKDAMIGIANDMSESAYEYDQLRVKKPIKVWIDEHLRSHPSPASREAKMRERLVEKNEELKKIIEHTEQEPIQK